MVLQAPDTVTWTFTYNNTSILALNKTGAEITSYDKLSLKTNINTMNRAKCTYYEMWNGSCFKKY